MDIYILRDGKEIGPFSEETTQSLLKQGSVLINDLAWQPGMPQWIPLHSVLYPPPGASSAKPPPPPNAALESAAAEPATERQKAFLSYMAIHFPPDATKAQAALLVNEAMENPNDPGRVSRWNEDRLRLHPDLFAPEIRARKENRASHFFEMVEMKGSGYFNNVTKAHCQVLVGYLDVQYPNWDARGDDAVFNYFFPAIAEKFPQLVTKEGKGRFKYPHGPKVAAELSRHARTPHVKAHRSPLASVARAIGFGVGFLLVVFAGYTFYTTNKSTHAGLADSNQDDASSISASGDVLLPAPDPTGTPPPNDATASDAPSRQAPETMFSDPSAATPRASVDTPAAGPIFDPAPSEAAFPNPNPAPTPAKTNLVLTKPTEVRSPFGPLRLPTGTPVKLISREGSMVQVRYRDEEYLIPVNSTDLLSSGTPARGSSPAPPLSGLATPAPPATRAPAATPPPMATPVPRLPESLF